jgi:hypothetical protein
MKFKLTAECKEFDGIKLFRIEALIDIPRWGVKAGDKGGWVEKEENLLQVYGDAWVSGNAQKTPIFIAGLKYPITITDAHMRIGCEFHTLAEWAVFDDARIARMDGVASSHFWKAHRDTLLAIAKADGRS